VFLERIGQVGEVPQFVLVNPTSMILVDEWCGAIASNVD
jgi:hypothetical protein